MPRSLSKALTGRIIAGLLSVMPIVSGASLEAQPLTGPDSTRRRLLARIERVTGGMPLHLLQIGDSHSANGYFAIELASSMAAVARIAPSYTVPFTRGLGLVVQTFSPEWSRSTWLQPVPGGVTGPGGTTAITRSPGATARFRLPEGLPASRLTLWWNAPVGTRFQLRLDGEPPIPLASGPLTDGALMARATVGIPAGTRELVLDDLRLPPGGEFRLHGFSIDHREALVTYDVLAAGGATHLHARHGTGGTLAAMLEARHPDVVLIWFGTNSVAGVSRERERFTREYAALVDTVRSRLPEAIVVLVGPPDLAKPLPGCGANPGSRSPSPSCVMSGGASCRPVSHPNVAIVRDEIRAVAQARGLLFLDVYHLYGEVGGMWRGYCATPPIGRSDGVHLTEAGYRDVARRFRALLRTPEF